MKRRERNAFAVSAVAHALVALGVVVYVRSHPVDFVFDAAIRTIDCDLVAGPLDLAAAVVTEPAATRPAGTLADPPSPLERSGGERPRSSAAMGSTMRGAHAGRGADGTATATPEEPRGELAGTPASGPFLAWHPRAPSAHGTSAALSGTDLIARADDEAGRAGLANGLQNMPSHGATDDGATTRGRTIGLSGSGSQARDASAGYVRRLLDDAAPTQIPGSARYYTQLARAASRAFRPVSVPTPSLVDAVVGTFFAPTSVGMDATRRSLGPLAEGRAGRALEELQFAHPNSDLLQPRNTMTARAAATARTTTAEIEIDQDASGRIIATRVLRRSGVTGFDRAALEAIQTSVRGLDTPEIHGVWRSHWAFDVTTSRDPILSALPGVAGAPGAFGITAEAEFDEVTGETELHLPGRVHTRRRARLMASHAVTPNETPRARSNRDGPRAP